jgi:hypothetical protein
MPRLWGSGWSLYRWGEARGVQKQQHTRTKTHRLGKLNKRGDVVAEGNGRNLGKDVEDGVSISVNEVVAARLGVVANDDVGAGILDLVDLGRLWTMSVELLAHAHIHIQLTAALLAGPGIAAVETWGLRGSSGMMERDEKARRGMMRAARAGRVATERIVGYSWRVVMERMWMKEERRSKELRLYVFTRWLGNWNWKPDSRRGWAAFSGVTVACNRQDAMGNG